MEKRNEKLTGLLMTDERLVVEENIDKNKAAELARKYDPELLSLLQKDDEIKDTFFSKTDGGLVFKKDIFLQFLSNKEFLPDSYTSYSDNIGLAVSYDKYLKEVNNVVLNWPYKDCILEGGQTKEDSKRKEIFFNEVLAPDQINRLLDPKVFVNWKRYDKDGEHQLNELKQTDNLIIKGNNLVVLHALKKRFAGRIKLIYIDPPYNTGSDSFGYNDSYNHSTWLTFMRNRLMIAHELLEDGGAIFVQCDDNEQAYLKVLMDEIFKNGFINTIAVKMSEASGVKMNHARRRFPKIKEYIHFYSKGNFPGFIEIDKYILDNWDNENNVFIDNFTQEDRDTIIDLESREPISNNDLELINKIFRKAKTVPLSRVTPNGLNDTDQKKWLFDNSYRIIKTAGSSSLARVVKLHKPNADLSQDIMADISTSGVLFYYITGFNRDTEQPRLQVIFSDANISKNPCDFWQDIKTTGAISNEGSVQLPAGKKPEKILERIIKMATRPGDIILDYHLGSGTTAAVAHKMNRQYIGIEQLYYGENDSVERLKNVIAGDQTGISKGVGWTGGGSFVYCNIENDANSFRDKVEKSKENEMLELLKEVGKSSFLSYRVNPKKLDEKEFKKLSLADQKHILLDLIDNNTLYVNYSDIDDNDYKISNEDKELNKQFYNEN